MATSHRLIEWADSYRDIAFDLVRCYLGIGLFVRGWLFITDASTLVNLLASSGESTFLSAAVVHYVALAHFGGGLMLAVGLLTRVAAFVQIPILIGAVFFVHLDDGLFAAGQSLEFSALVLVLLAITFFHGSGRFSLDHYLFERSEARAAREAQLGLFVPPREPVPAPHPREEEGGVATTSERLAADGPSVPPGCTCAGARDRDHPRVRVERRYGLRALRFLTGTTGTPKEIVFRCRDCRNVLEVSRDKADIARYTYR